MHIEYKNIDTDQESFFYHKNAHFYFYHSGLQNQAMIVYFYISYYDWQRLFILHSISVNIFETDLSGAMLYQTRKNICHGEKFRSAWICGRGLIGNWLLETIFNI